MAIGDLNGDSNPDLAVTFTNSGVSVLVGNGTGSMTTARIATADGLGHDARSVAIGDLNGDGKGDLAIASTSDRDGVSVLLGKGEGPSCHRSRCARADAAIRRRTPS